MNVMKFAREAGAWHYFLLQELRKKQMGEAYHESLVLAALRHLQCYCSNDAFKYYHDAYRGSNIL